jgi:hypothetical protein
MNFTCYEKLQGKREAVKTAHLTILALLTILVPIAASQINASKAQVSENIRRVEDGVDEFRNYLERRRDDARNASSQSQGRKRGRTASDQQKATATAKKDELSKALDDLNSSTNRLRRKFDKTDAWVKTRGDVERVLDDGRKINQVVARGNSGADAARLWAALRTQMNELARVYGVTPLNV